MCLRFGDQWKAERLHFRMCVGVLEVATHTLRSSAGQTAAASRSATPAAPLRPKAELQVQKLCIYALVFEIHLL